MTTLGYSGGDISVMSQQQPPSSYINSAGTNPTDAVNFSQISGLAVAIPLNTISTNTPNTGNVSMNNYKLTGLGNGASSTDSVAYGQLSGLFQSKGLVGTIVTSPVNTISNASLLQLNGSSYSSTTYPTLFSVIGTTTLPNIEPSFNVSIVSLFNQSTSGGIVQTGAYSNTLLGSYTWTSLIAAFDYIEISGLINNIQFSCNFQCNQMIASQQLQIAIANASIVGNVDIGIPSSLSSTTFAIITQSGLTITSLSIKGYKIYSSTALYSYIIAQ